MLGPGTTSEEPSPASQPEANQGTEMASPRPQIQKDLPRFQASSNSESQTDALLLPDGARPKVPSPKLDPELGQLEVFCMAGIRKATPAKSLCFCLDSFILEISPVHQAIILLGK